MKMQNNQHDCFQIDTGKNNHDCLQINSSYQQLCNKTYAVSIFQSDVIFWKKKATHILWG